MTYADDHADYVRSQFARLGPTYADIYRVQISGSEGETNYLNISPAAVSKIMDIIIADRADPEPIPATTATTEGTPTA